MVVTATAEALRHCLALVEPLLGDFLPPAGAFDPAGTWSHTYRIVPLKAAPAAFGGQLKICRTAQPGGAQFEVQQELRMMKQYAQWSKASIQCAADHWCTPQRYTVESWTTGQDGQVEADTHGEFSAEATGSEIRFAGTSKPAMRVADDWTLDWTLFGALQRLPTTEAAQWQFDLVEDGDLLRPRQQLSYVGTLATELAGKAMELYGFFHVGTGTLPTHYWLDQQHRLLLAIRYYRAFVLQPSGNR
jgi:hypothetical protein